MLNDLNFERKFFERSGLREEDWVAIIDEWDERMLMLYDELYEKFEGKMNVALIDLLLERELKKG